MPLFPSVMTPKTVDINPSSLIEIDARIDSSCVCHSSYDTRTLARNNNHNLAAVPIWKVSLYQNSSTAILSMCLYCWLCLRAVSYAYMATYSRCEQYKQKTGLNAKWHADYRLDKTCRLGGCLVGWLCQLTCVSLSGGRLLILFGMLSSLKSHASSPHVKEYFSWAAG